MRMVMVFSSTSKEMSSKARRLPKLFERFRTSRITPILITGRRVERDAYVIPDGLAVHVTESDCADQDPQRFQLAVLADPVTHQIKKSPAALSPFGSRRVHPVTP